MLVLLVSVSAERHAEHTLCLPGLYHAGARYQICSTSYLNFLYCTVKRYGLYINQIMHDGASSEKKGSQTESHADVIIWYPKKGRCDCFVLALSLYPHRRSGGCFIAGDG